MIDFFKKLFNIGWISVRKKLPAYSCCGTSAWVVVLHKNGTWFKAYYDFNSKCWYDEENPRTYIPFNYVTHWMKVPRL